MSSPDRENVEEFIRNVFRPRTSRPGGPRLPLGPILLVIVGLVLLRGVFFTVDPEEAGIVLRFGEFVRMSEPGLHVKVPLGVEKVIKVPVERQLKEEFGFRTVQAGQKSTYRRDTRTTAESLMLTGDLNIADVEWIVQYKIVDPVAFLFKVRNSPETFRDMSEAVMRAVIGDRSVDEVLTIGRQECEDRAVVRLKELCKQYELGIDVQLVAMQDVNPPDPVKPSFNEVNQAEQERETLINQARSDLNREIPKAEGEANATIEAAHGYAIDRVNKARGETARFVALVNEYRKSPEVTRRRLYLETMRDILPKAGKVVVVDESVKGVLPLLNLDTAGKGESEMSRRIVSILIVAVLVLLFVGNSFYTVSEAEQVIVTQFGKPQGDPITKAGLHWKIPFIQKVNRFEKRWLAWDGDANQMPTRDKKFIWVDTYARWRIADPLLFFQRVRDERGAQTRLDDILDGETRKAVANVDLIEVVRTQNREFEVSVVAISVQPDVAVSPPIQIGREAITREILTRASEKINAFGIELVDVQFKRINYADEVRRTVYDRMISERQKIRDKLRSQGQGRSAEIRGTKERELKRIGSGAYRTAQEIRGASDSTAAAVYAEAYNLDPEFYAFQRTLETYAETFQGEETLVLSTEGEFYRYLKEGVAR